MAAGMEVQEDIRTERLSHQASFLFPEDFLWGTATSSHQVEGHNTNNQWWDWEQSPGHIRNGNGSGWACDWWRNAESDFDRMVELGITSHRLSIEWSRVQPAEGKFDSAAVDRYRAMLLGLRRRGIKPMVTLHHFTNPRWLEERGGWEQHNVVVRFFRQYAAHMVKALGDLCDLWCTINEPNVYALLGYVQSGTMPPGKTDQFDRAIQVMSNMLFAHAAAYEVLHEHQSLAQVGIAHHMRLFEPYRKDHMLDRAVAGLQDQVFNQGILTALLQGKWNMAMRRGQHSSASKLLNTLDWIGLNYNTRQGTMFDASAGAGLFERPIALPGGMRADYGYGEIYPEGIQPLLSRLGASNLPIYITENGIPDASDCFRPEFLVRQVRAIWNAVQDLPIQGYYHYSLIDSFEWSEGWRLKFGLFSVDPISQERTPRRSAFLYRDMIRKNGIDGDIVDQYAPQIAQRMFP